LPDLKDTAPFYSTKQAHIDPVHGAVMLAGLLPLFEIKGKGYLLHEGCFIKLENCQKMPEWKEYKTYYFWSF